MTNRELAVAELNRSYSDQLPMESAKLAVLRSIAASLIALSGPGPEPLKAPLGFQGPDAR